MRKRFLLISTIFVLSAFTFAACGKKSPSSPEAGSEKTTTEATTEATTEKATTEATTEDKKATTATEKEQPVSTATETATTEKTTTETTTATKKDEEAKPATATGTYNGFADTNSVEVEMSDGSFETFLVNDDDVKDALNKKGEGSKITFTYGAVEGQANKEILSIK